MNRSLLPAVALSIFASSSSHADVNWIGGTGNWNVTSNWSGGLLPGVSADATIGTPNGGVITVNSDVATGGTTAYQLRLSDGVVVNVGSGALVSVGGAVTVGFNSEAATLNIAGGTFNHPGAVFSVLSTGVVTVSGGVFNATGSSTDVLAVAGTFNVIGSAATMTGFERVNDSGQAAKNGIYAFTFDAGGISSIPAGPRLYSGFTVNVNADTIVGSASIGDKFTLFTSSGLRDTTGATTTAGTFLSGLTFNNLGTQVNGQLVITGTNLQYEVTSITPVPEPAVFALVAGLGTLGLVGLRRRLPGRGPRS